MATRTAIEGIIDYLIDQENTPKVKPTPKKKTTPKTKSKA